VTVSDNGNSWTLNNGIVKATVTKDSGSMPSLIYHGLQMMAASGGTWEHNPLSAPTVTNRITIDPAANGGTRAEVSIKGLSGGTFVMTRDAPGGGTLCDIEIRYSLGKGDSGIYVYEILSHPASYPAAGVGAEDRYITRLNQDFDWITVDKDRNMLEAAPTDWGTGVVVHAKEQRIMSKGVYKNSVEHKYSYSGMQGYTKAYGWSSTKNHVGMWFINPTNRVPQRRSDSAGSRRTLWRQRGSGADHPRLLAQRPLQRGHSPDCRGRGVGQGRRADLCLCELARQADSCDAGRTSDAGRYGGKPDRPGQLDSEFKRAVEGRHGAGEKGKCQVAIQL